MFEKHTCNVTEGRSRGVQAAVYASFRTRRSSALHSIELCAAQLFNYTLDQFSEQLATAGLESNVTLVSIAPVNGYTLEAQMRALNDLPSVNVEGAALLAEPPLAPAPPLSARYVQWSPLGAVEFLQR